MATRGRRGAEARPRGPPGPVARRRAPPPVQRRRRRRTSSTPCQELLERQDSRAFGDVAGDPHHGLGHGRLRDGADVAEPLGHDEVGRELREERTIDGVERSTCAHRLGDPPVDLGLVEAGRQDACRGSRQGLDGRREVTLVADGNWSARPSAATISMTLGRRLTMRMGAPAWKGSIPGARGPGLIRAGCSPGSCWSGRPPRRRGGVCVPHHAREAGRAAGLRQDSDELARARVVEGGLDAVPGARAAGDREARPWRCPPRRSTTPARPWGSRRRPRPPPRWGSARRPPSAPRRRSAGRA